MPPRRRRPDPPERPPERPPEPEGDRLPMLGEAFSATTEIARPPVVRPPPAPRAVERGVVVFDMDGTLVDSIGLISHVAADVLHRAFGTPPDEGRIHYLATTGMPFEAQLAQLYPDVPVEERLAAARIFHHRKVQEAYAHAAPFPDVPRMLRRLSSARWTLAISTGAEAEMADLLLEREGLRYWFDDLLGSGQGTKREHLVEYARRFPGVPRFLVGDSRFDMEAARDSPGVVALGRASRMHGWTLSPDDLARWGAQWAEYSLEGLPDALERLVARPRAPARRRQKREGPGPRVSGRGVRPRARLNPGRGIHSPPG